MENTNMHYSMPSAKSPAVSVIVPAYNDEKYIKECLDSVLAQTFQDYEVICIDDGSADKSLSIFKEYAERDPRIKVMRQNNQGIVAVRNNAIAAARGEYIFPLDSDDIIAPDCLEVLYNFITTHDYAVVCPGARYFRDFEEGRTYYPWDRPNPTRWNMYCLNIGMHCASMYPKKLWKKYGGYDHLFDKGMEDYDFWLNFIDDGQKAILLPDLLFFNRLKPAEESRSRHYGRWDKKLHKQLKANLRRKHPKIIIYRYLHRILRFFFRRETTERGFTIRIFKIAVYQNSRAN